MNRLAARSENETQIARIEEKGGPATDYTDYHRRLALGDGEVKLYDATIQEGSGPTSSKSGSSRSM